MLTDAAKNGLPGEHHFYISFDTGADGVKLSPRLRAQYPRRDDHRAAAPVLGPEGQRRGFEVGLSFSGVPERLRVPFDAIKGFFDPSVQFGAAVRDRRGDDEAATRPPSRRADARPSRQRRRTRRRAQAARHSAAAGPRAVPRRRRRRTKRRPSRRRAATSRTAAPRSCGSTASARSDAPSRPRDEPRPRTETDTFGPIEVPADRYWGAQTAALAARISASAPSACRCR